MKNRMAEENICSDPDQSIMDPQLTQKFWQQAQVFVVIYICGSFTLSASFFPSLSYLIPQNSWRILLLSMSMLSALHQQSKLWFCLRSCTQGIGWKRLIVPFEMVLATLKTHNCLMVHGMFDRLLIHQICLNYYKLIT